MDKHFINIINKMRLTYFIRKRNRRLVRRRRLRHFWYTQYIFRMKRAAIKAAADNKITATKTKSKKNTFTHLCNYLWKVLS